MSRYSIKEELSGRHMGIWEANSPEHALDIMSRAIGFKSHAHACSEIREDPAGHWISSLDFKSGGLIVTVIQWS